MNKPEVIKVLKEIAILLELKGESVFKVRAYINAARALELLDENFESLLENNELSKIDGIGSALSEKISLLYYSGNLPYYESLKKSINPKLVKCLEIPGIGAKKLRLLNEKLGIEDEISLKKSCISGELAKLDGFGPKSSDNILAAIKYREANNDRHLWWSLKNLVYDIINGLEKLKSVSRVSVAGSYRRCLETIGDLDFIVASNNPNQIREWIKSYFEIEEFIASGKTKLSFRLKRGIQIDIRIVPDKNFIYALHYFTGSKEHNIILRKKALKMGYSLNEWGIYLNDGSNRLADKTDKIKNESDLFNFFSLSNIEPELREGSVEFKLAEKKNLPKLVELNDINGVFHNHTTFSDGKNTIEEMVLSAEKKGWEYIGFADHSKSSYQANGLDEEEVLSMIDIIKKFNESSISKVNVFTGIECDILKDGSLDLSYEVLDKLDYVVASVHSSFGLSESDMTKRIIKAIESPCVTMLAHPTGRLLLKREPYALNINKIIDAAIENKVIIEINANPRRLDMDWRLWRDATNKGLLCSINPDAHSVDDLDYYHSGVNIARKGWIKKDRILNTRSLDGVISWFKYRV